MFANLAEKLQRTLKNLRGKGKLSEKDVDAAMREIRLALLEADVNFKVVKDFVASIRERAVGQEVLSSLTPGQQVVKIVHQELTRLMGQEQSRLATAPHPPTVIMMVGLQGSGKTTTAVKLALQLKKGGRNPLLVAADIYRPGAVQQLEILSQSVALPCYSHSGATPVEICTGALKQAFREGNDHVIIDTAGRLHLDEAMMQELKEIKAAVKPAEVLLVVDAMTGQDAVNAAAAFHESVGLTGIILTKLDGDTRGGAALSVRAVTGKPIKFVGMGEKLDALEPFHPDRMASRILGMGDVLTLIEKAQTNIDLKEAERLAKNLEKNKFDLNDLLEQMKQLRKMGPLETVLSMIPGVGGKISEEDAALGEKNLRQIESIIYSMTPEERSKPDIINPSRKRRIAAGSGTKVEDVNRLLKQHRDMQRLFKQMTGKTGSKKRRRLPLGGMGGFGPGNLPF